MKKTYLTTLIMLFAVSGALARPSVVKLCSDPWPPYTRGTIGEQATGGFAIRTHQEIFDRMGIKVEFPVTPWKRCLQMIEKGLMDGAITCIYSKERLSYLSTTDPYFITKGVWYYMKERFPDGFEWKVYDDFEGYRVVGVLGNYYQEQFNDAHSRGVFTFIRTRNETLALKQLAAGRHDFFLSEKLVGDQGIRSVGLEGRVASPRKPLYVNTQRFCIGKKSPLHELIPEINDKISELKTEDLIEVYLRNERQ